MNGIELMNMDKRLTYIIQELSRKNPLHGKKLKKNLEDFDDQYFEIASNFLNKLDGLLQSKDKNIDYAIECYLHMLADVTFDTIDFMRTGKYRSSSFEEVNKRVYDNPDIMEYYMYGLLLSQILWTQHYEILRHFNKIIKKNKLVRNYLEIGAGHGLYLSEAIEIVGKEANYDVVDISASSISIAKEMARGKDVNYYLSDVFKFHPNKKYDFITCGEVLEHMEDPASLLNKIASMLSEKGKLYITTPTNAPAIDHIYLFTNAEEIREIIYLSGFEIVEETCFYSEKLEKEQLEKFKVSMLYAGLLIKK
ncbi:class I SAM-dependent methyltransferase [Ekhidna sp.]|uniref:class I SAM-dependent methyltransferase n=1 Tax=Ekhidna sp. TaxID=2608089 RepID=UPI003B50DE6B